MKSLRQKVKSLTFKEQDALFWKIFTVAFAAIVICSLAQGFTVGYDVDYSVAYPLESAIILVATGCVYFLKRWRCETYVKEEDDISLEIAIFIGSFSLALMMALMLVACSFAVSMIGLYIP